MDTHTHCQYNASVYTNLIKALNGRQYSTAYKYK